MWAKYASNMGAKGAPPSGVAISPTAPGSNWEAPGNGDDEQSTAAVTSNVVNNPGAIGPVQVNYANDSGFTGSNPAKAVAAGLTFRDLSDSVEDVIEWWDDRESPSWWLTREQEAMLVRTNP